MDRVLGSTVQPNGPQRSAIDIGKVLLLGNTKQMALERIVQEPIAPFAVEVVSLAVRRDGAENTHLVSRVKMATLPDNRVVDRQDLLRAWLKEQRFFEQTGMINDDEDGSVSPEQKHVHWCREWREKGAIMRRLGITWCVDDQPDVHESVALAYSDLQLGNHEDRRLRQYGFNYTPDDRLLTATMIQDGKLDHARVMLVNDWKEVGLREGLL